MFIPWLIRLFQRATTKANCSSVQQTTQMRRYWYVELAKITNRFLCNSESKNNFSSSMCSEVWHEWLDTLSDDNKTNRKKKCLLALKQQSCYTSVSAPSRNLSKAHKPYSPAETQLTVRFYATTTCFIFRFTCEWRRIIIKLTFFFKLGSYFKGAVISCGVY